MNGCDGGGALVNEIESLWLKSFVCYWLVSAAAIVNRSTVMLVKCACAPELTVDEELILQQVDSGRSSKLREAKANRPAGASQAQQTSLQTAHHSSWWAKATQIAEAKSLRASKERCISMSAHKEGAKAVRRWEFSWILRYFVVSVVWKVVCERACRRTHTYVHTKIQIQVIDCKRSAVAGASSQTLSYLASNKDSCFVFF